MLEVRVNNQVFTGWKDATVTRSIESLYGAFTMNVTQTNDPVDGLDSLPIESGDKCSLWINGQPVITGHADKFRESFSRTHSLTISGRDKTGDLCDCSAILPGGQLKNQTVDQIISRLVEPFGIPIVREVNLGAVIPNFQIEQGESVKEAIQRLIKNRNVLAMSDGNGNLVLTRTGRRMVATPLVMGVNLKELEAEEDETQRFSQYIVKGQNTTTRTANRQTTNQVKGEADNPTKKRRRKTNKAVKRKLRVKQIRTAAQVRRAVDTEIMRYRPLVIISNDPMDAKSANDRAVWEKVTREAKAFKLSATVAGWLTDVVDGEVWPLNCLVRVKAPKYSGVYLIDELEYSLARNGGSTTHLTLVPPEAYAFEPA